MRHERAMKPVARSTVVGSQGGILVALARYNHPSLLNCTTDPLLSPEPVERFNFGKFTTSAG
jgi:hypothetical protein